MDIHGLQKMTLLDFPGHVAATVFLGGCDLRCPFCHNFSLADGSAPALMGEDELFVFLEKRRGLLDGVAITGGEPCLRPGLPDFLRRIRNLGYAVKLDTNGTHPDLLARVLAEGLADYVAMDVKNSREKYARTCGVPSIDLCAIQKSMDLLTGGCVEYEFRTTLVRELHNKEDVAHIAAWIQGAKRYVLQSFTDRDSVPFEGFHAPTREELFAWRDIAASFVEEALLRGVD